MYTIKNKSWLSIIGKLAFLACIFAWLILKAVFHILLAVFSSMEDNGSKSTSDLGDNCNYNTGELDAIKYSDGSYQEDIPK